ncbi:efflux transporter outer membrane subunit [Ramlibacter sp. G-1-2-2]|uniref:Efflux transporter outer membrane subunit n=1 Tax=Ramlibacter agri TaxID=2728837 RepID=A0A848GZ58_9BURK|nr:efflux transporter outer membrane subunit [Ramlibacter agri]NML43986.1 efflux transporter outer membrane subunit [Ramlibacter agri]
MKLLKLTVLAAAAVAAAGCSFIPTYERPVAPVANQFPYPGAKDGRAASDLKWQEFFTDPHLRELITMALANNRDLRVAVLNIEQARAAYDVRKADQLPSVGLQAQVSRAPNIANIESTTYQVGLALSSWEIDFFGRIRALSEQALNQYLATEEGRNAAQATLVASVANAYMGVAADEELLALTRETLTTREESLRLTRLRFENGASSEIDFRQAQSLYESARTTLAQQQRQRATDINALALLLGAPVPPDFMVGVSTDKFALPDLPAGVPSEVLVKRPDVHQAELQLIAANANIGAARAAFFPRITLTAAAGIGSSELNKLVQGGTFAYSITPTLLQPIFDAGRNQANLGSSVAGREIAVAQYEKAIQSAFKDVADALAGRATYGDQLDAQGKVVEAETVRNRLAKLRYDNGVASYLDLLDSQRSLFAAQQALVQARLARLQNQVQLYRSLGGGWAS